VVTVEVLIGSVEDLKRVSVGRAEAEREARVDDMSVTVGPKPSLGATEGVTGDRGDVTASGISIEAYKGPTK
jgi:hypothetical protein